MGWLRPRFLLLMSWAFHPLTHFFFHVRAGHHRSEDLAVREEVARLKSGRVVVRPEQVCVLCVGADLVWVAARLSACLWLQWDDDDQCVAPMC